LVNIEVARQTSCENAGGADDERMMVLGNRGGHVARRLMQSKHQCITAPEMPETC
jgi:hypothetical protein